MRVKYGRHRPEGGNNDRLRDPVRPLPIANLLRRKVGAGEDLRPWAQRPRSKLPPLPRSTLCRRASKLLGKTPNGNGYSPNQRPRRLALEGGPRTLKVIRRIGWRTLVIFKGAGLTFQLPRSWVLILHHATKQENRASSCVIARNFRASSLVNRPAAKEKYEHPPRVYLLSDKHPCDGGRQ